MLVQSYSLHGKFPNSPHRILRSALLNYYSTLLNDNSTLQNIYSALQNKQSSVEKQKIIRGERKNYPWWDKKLLREVHFCQLTKASSAVMMASLFIMNVKSWNSRAETCTGLGRYSIGKLLLQYRLQIYLFLPIPASSACLFCYCPDELHSQSGRSEKNLPNYYVSVFISWS